MALITLLRHASLAKQHQKCYNGHIDLDIENEWTPQWEYNYTFNISRNGSFKLAFLLFTEPTEEYDPDEDYFEIAEQKIDSAYRELHLWLTIT